MKVSLWMTMLGLACSVPGAQGMTEVETLRDRCAQQERQIRRLEAEIDHLKSRPSESAASTPERTAKVASPPVIEAPVKETPAKETPVQEAPAKGVAAGGGVAYTVRAGDSFDKIARKHGTTAEKLAQANGLELTSILHIGQKLVLTGKAGAHGKSEGTAPARPTESTGTHQTPGSGSAAVKQVGEAATPAGQASTASKTPAAKGPSPATGKVVDKTKIHAVRIENEMTYGEFAAKHGTDTKRLNELNGLDLTKSRVLAKGSELYVPGQPAGVTHR